MRTDFYLLSSSFQSFCGRDHTVAPSGRPGSQVTSLNIAGPQRDPIIESGACRWRCDRDGVHSRIQAALACQRDCRVRMTRGFVFAKSAAQSEAKSSAHPCEGPSPVLSACWHAMAIDSNRQEIVDRTTNRPKDNCIRNRAGV